jgi:hypothetical protein
MHLFDARPPHPRGTAKTLRYVLCRFTTAAPARGSGSGMHGQQKPSRDVESDYEVFVQLFTLQLSVA